MEPYDTLRRRYKPARIRVLLIAESPPPSAKRISSRHFYRHTPPRQNDRLFVNTMKALYPETTDMPETELESHKEQWLRRFQHEGWYMIEALETSLPHEVTKPERQTLIRQHLPRLVMRLRQLIKTETPIVLIKSNVFEAAAAPLREAGFSVLNTELVDYPGRFNQRAYRQKLAALAQSVQLG